MYCAFYFAFWGRKKSHWSRRSVKSPKMKITKMWTNYLPLARQQDYPLFSQIYVFPLDTWSSKVWSGPILSKLTYKKNSSQTILLIAAAKMNSLLQWTLYTCLESRECWHWINNVTVPHSNHVPEHLRQCRRRKCFFRQPELWYSCQHEW